MGELGPGVLPVPPQPASPTSRMLHRSERHSTSSQGWNMPRVTQLSMMTSMLACSNHVQAVR
jgi:hypothetical protein